MFENALFLVTLACVFQGIGQSLQKHGVSQELPSLTLRRVGRDAGAVLRALIASRTWALGIASLLVGGWLGFLALAHGDLSFVLPLSNLTTLITVMLGVLVLGERLGAREWSGVGLLLVGSVAIASSAGDMGRPPTDRSTTWAVALAAMAAAALCIRVGEIRPDPVRRETLLGLGAGLLFGATNFLLKATTEAARQEAGRFSLADGATLLALVSEPTFYLFLAGVVAGFVMLQIAYANGRISVVYPLKQITTVGSGVVFGFLVFGETAGMLRVVGAGVVLVGMTLLMGRRSPQPALPLAGEGAAVDRIA